MLQAGIAAPSFELPDADMEMISLSAYKGRKNVVLFFYPKDGTPACTQEAIEFGDHHEDFAAHDTVVFGISRDDCLAHAEFRDRHGLDVELLSDEEGDVCRQYDVLNTLEKDGKRRECVARVTFVIDKGGTIRHTFPEVAPRGHAFDVLNVIKKL